MALKKSPNSQYWIAQFMVGGKRINRSTHETDKRKAAAKVEELKRQARLLYGQPAVAKRFSEARVAEVARLEADVSSFQAARAEYGLWNFQKWAGDISLDRINQKVLEQYQRHRLAKATKGTVGKELCFLVRLLMNNGIAA